jgi:hypothetical protein
VKLERMWPKGKYMTIGTERLGLRIARGHLDRHGKFHDNWPNIFVLWRHRRL